MIRILSIFVLAWVAAILPAGLFAQSDADESKSLSKRLQQEKTTDLAKAARESGDPVQGAILFSQKKFNCVGCHAQGSTDLLGSDLTQIAKDVPDEYFVESVLLPSKVIKKGFETVTILDLDGRVLKGRIVDENASRYILRDTSPEQRLMTVPRNSIEELKVDTQSSMPEALADQLASRKEFLDLIRYLMDIAASGTPNATGPTVKNSRQVDPQVQGLALLQQYHCTNCHASDVGRPGGSGSDDGPHGLHIQVAPDLTLATSRIDPAYIQRFIADPQTVKPATPMPQMMANLAPAERKKTALAITHYLVSLNDQPFQRQALSEDAASRGERLFHSVGCVACHSPRNSDGKEEILEDSVALGDLASKYNVNGLTGFLENPHTIRPSGRMPNLKLTHWEALDIANYLLRSVKANGANQHSPAFVLDPSAAAIGKAKFRDLGCIDCHHETESETVPRWRGWTRRTAMKLSQVDPDRGCLSGVTGIWPEYTLSSAQRGAIQTAITKLQDPLSTSQQITVTLQALRCYACHERDGVGGISDERDPFFLTTNENLGPQGRIPPPLTNVGAKLKPKWLRQVLVSGRAIRPYMETRMPQYGTEHVAHLVDLFQQADELPQVRMHQFDDPKEIRKIGTELVGSGGLNCIACHTFQQKPALTMPALDLTEMADRLHKEWFFDYMRSPQTISPNTVMPSFWPGGKAIRKEILNGDTDQQISAVWEYLQDGRQARVPRGLRREPIELLASHDRAAMLRRSYPGIGKRGIGVGYPSGVNLAFDAEQLRIAMIWKGKFADPGGVWRSQGHGTVRPLGSDLLRFEAGPELDSAESPWVVDDRRPPQHRFTGYFLDQMDRPTFTYQLDDITVKDFAMGGQGETPETTTLHRKLVFHSKQPRDDLAFRIRTKDSITRESANQFRLGKALQIKVNQGQDVKVVTDSAGSHLHIPLTLSDGESELTLHYTW